MGAQRMDGLLLGRAEQSATSPRCAVNGCGARLTEHPREPPFPAPCRVQERRTQLFSATMTSKVAKLQRACLRDPVKGKPSLPGVGQAPCQRCCRVLAGLGGRPGQRRPPCAHLHIAEDGDHAAAALLHCPCSWLCEGAHWRMPARTRHVAPLTHPKPPKPQTQT